MSILSAVQAKIINRMNPVAEKIKLGDSIREGQIGSVFAYTLDKSAAAFNSAAVEVFTAPFAMRIIDVIVNAQATEGSGVATIYKGTDAIGTAIACAADGAVTHLSAGAVVANKARMVLAAGDVVKTQASGGTAANIRGIVTVVCQRL